MMDAFTLDRELTMRVQLMAETHGVEPSSIINTSLRLLQALTPFFNDEHTLNLLTAEKPQHLITIDFRKY